MFYNERLPASMICDDKSLCDDTFALVEKVIKDKLAVRSLALFDLFHSIKTRFNS